MTTSDVDPSRVYVWVWLPGGLEPVVAGVLQRTAARFGLEPVLAFAYASSYREHPSAIALFSPELPLIAGTLDPTRPGQVDAGRFPRWRGYPAATERSPKALAGCLRDAAPDAWGRRVINLRLAHDPEQELSELAYLLNSSSDRIGALDFQTSPTVFVPRGEAASLDQLVDAAELIDAGQDLPPELNAAADHGTSIGGARPKALLTDGAAQLVAKFSSSADDRPVVKSEGVAMLLARRVGLDVPDVRVVRARGRDVLLIDRFDRTPTGSRRMLVSGLTVLGLREEEARYATYAELARAIRHPGWADAKRQLTELYTRLVFNVVIGNTDDHLRNHSAFWDGTELQLTPAYDLVPQRRSTQVATHAIGLTTDGERASQLRVARRAAAEFLLGSRDADDIIDHVLSTVRSSWADVCDEVGLSRAERDQLLGREILNEYIFYEQP